MTTFAAKALAPDLRATAKPIDFPCGQPTAVDQAITLLAALGRLGYGFTLVQSAPTNPFSGLRLLSHADYSQAFTSKQLPSLARLYISRFEQYYVGLLF